MEKLADANRRIEILEANTDPSPAPTFEAPEPPARLPAVSPLTAIALGFILLVLAHFLIIIQFNLSLVYLRVVSIAVPLAFGVLCRDSGKRSLPLGFAYGVLLALASIIAMSAIVGKIDNVPVLPRDAYEWREFAEYGASIAFGFLTGVIIRQILNSMRSAARQVKGRSLSILSRTIAKRLNGKVADVELAKLESIIRTGAAIVSGIISITTGLKQFL